MKYADRTNFADGVMSRYEQLGRVASRYDRSLAVREAAPTTAPPVGHPDFAHLAIGETALCSLAVGFIDMRAMTARSFWEPLSAVTRLSLAVLGQVAEVVQDSGGYVLGMRGDGLMAGWGDTQSQPATDVYMAMAACAFSLDAVHNSLNDMLTMSGLEPVQICAGADCGEVCFARTGTDQGSEVNIVGHPANFAAKCEKTANAWEVVIGEGAAEQITNKSLLAAHANSPKTYEHLGERRRYSFFDFAWRRIVAEAASAIDQVNGTPTSAINYGF